MDRVMVTGVGGGVGQSIIKALYDSEYEVVAVDAEELAVGLYAADKGYQGEYASHPKFIERLLEIARTENCRLIFPGHDVELMPLALNADAFRAADVIPVVSGEEVISISDDKMLTAEFVAGCGLPAPKTWMLSEDTPREYPVVLKPRLGGARSRNTYVARDAGEFEAYRTFVDADNCLVQEFIDGEEYTCGTVNFDGVCHGSILMRRMLRAGDTYKAFVERNDVIDGAVRKAAEALQPFGACNFQLRIRDGQPYIFEINARCSGTTAARALVGFNEPRTIADFLLHGKPPEYTIEETTILRYWNEIVVPYESVEAVRRTRTVPTPVGRL